MTLALLNQPTREVTMKDPAQLREDLKKFPRVTAEEAARMDVETPPCEPYVKNPRRQGVMIHVDELLEAKRKSMSSENGN